VELEGWPDLSIESWRKLGREGAYALPAKVLYFAQALEDLVGQPVGYISYGPERSDMVRMA
jgi:adenylosuccinate synthase